MRSASAFLQGCQITNFTKFEINSRNLGSTFLHKYGLVVLRQHVINFQQRHFGVKDSKHQRLSSSNGVFCWAWLEREAKAPTFLKTPQMQSIGQCMLALGSSISSIHTLIWNSSFCQQFRQGSELVNWENSTLGWAQRLRNGAKTWGRWEISRRAVTNSISVSDQTDFFILVQQCGPESLSTQAILKQIKSYIHLEFHFCAFLQHPRSLTFQNLQLLYLH